MNKRYAIVACFLMATSQLTKLKLLNTVGKTLRVFDVQGSYILDLKEYPAAIYYLQDSRNNKSYKLIKK